MPPKHTPVKKTKPAGTNELETVSTAAGFSEEENAYNVRGALSRADRDYITTGMMK